MSFLSHWLTKFILLYQVFSPSPMRVKQMFHPYSKRHLLPQGLQVIYSKISNHHRIRPSVAALGRGKGFLHLVRHYRYPDDPRAVGRSRRACSGARQRITRPHARRNGQPISAHICVPVAFYSGELVFCNSRCAYNYYNAPTSSTGRVARDHLPFPDPCFSLCES